MESFIVNGLAEVFCKWGNELIIVAAVVNAFFFFKTNDKIKKAEKEFHPESDKVNGVSANMQWDSKNISELKKMRKGLVKSYAWYANITAIFPLLGIMGTVAALVTYSNETMMENLMVALTTTLIGVFCAIVFKAIDALISGPLDVIIDDMDHVIQEYDHRNGRKEAQG